MCAFMCLLIITSLLTYFFTYLFMYFYIHVKEINLEVLVSAGLRATSEASGAPRAKLAGSARIGAWVASRISRFRVLGGMGFRV